MRTCRCMFDLVVNAFVHPGCEQRKAAQKKFMISDAVFGQSTVRSRRGEIDEILTSVTGVRVHVG